MSKCFTVLGEFNLSDINVANCFISVNQTRKLSKEATDILRNDVKQMGINNVSELEAPYKKSFSNVCTMHISICLTSLTRAKCGVRSTLCWKVGNISGST